MRIVKSSDKTGPMVDKLSAHFFHEHAIETSCFLEESCEESVFLALRDPPSMEILGCVAVQSGTSLSPYDLSEAPQHLVHTLCVSHTARGTGVGIGLLLHVISSIPPTHRLHLSICCPSRSTRNRAATAVLAVRRSRLTRLYISHGFVHQGEKDGHVWMSRMGGNPVVATQPGVGQRVCREGGSNTNASHAGRGSLVARL